HTSYHFLSQRYPPPPDLHSFPTRRSSDLSAKRRGIDPLVIDAGALANSIVRYPIGMTFFTTPERLEIGGHPLVCAGAKATREEADRKSTRLNSSHLVISYAVFCLKKKNNK